MNIAKLMIPKVCTTVLHENNTIRQGLEILTRCRFSAIPVLDAEGRYVGSVTEGDFLQHVLKTGKTNLKDQEAYHIKDISDSPGLSDPHRRGRRGAWTSCCGHPA